MFIRELTQPVKALTGVGPKKAEAFRRLGITTIGELLQHYPRSYEDRKSVVLLASAATKDFANTTVEVVAQDYFGKGPQKTLKVWVKDESGVAVLVCFGRNHLARSLTVGTRWHLYGAFQYRFGELQATAFDLEPADAASPRFFGRILPVYPATEGLSQKDIRRTVKRALQEYGGPLASELPDEVLKTEDLPSKNRALAAIHFPDNFQQIDKAAESLKFEELFYLQLLSARRAFRRREASRPAVELDLCLKNRLLESLPFRLTPDQEEAVKTITAEMGSPYPMARLLQGDVGSGKTLVAFLAALLAVGRGDQAALMAPTELLARQHAENAAAILEPLGVKIAFLSGNIRSEGRKHLLSALAAGDIDLVIGTHALFTEDVVYNRLGLIVIDEQHRFGVLQRIALREKAESPDLLMMTATPIPRTLAMTAFGDLQVLNIKSMPAGRSAVETHLAAQGKEDKVYRFVKREIEKGHQAYFVYPLIAQSEKSALKDAESMFRHLSEAIFPDYRLALIHSQIAEEEKKGRMDSFIRGEIDILVATSVVEVGVDVGNATCMVIEHAERFGLAALHQLRGRVGRGSAQSYAFLVYNPDLNDEGRLRLKIMKENSDGFVIAEEDLKLRGPGQVSGSRQSGFADFQIADLRTDLPLLERARKQAHRIIEDDPALLLPANQIIREVLNRCPPFRESFFSL